MGKFIRILLVFMLLFSAFLTEAMSGSAAKEYLVLFKKDKLPQDYQQLIASAGGSVVTAIPQIGAVLAQTERDDFLVNLGQDLQVEEAGINPEVALRETLGRPLTAVAANPPQPGDLYNMFQWDIQRVGGTPATWAKQSGNHNVVVAVVDTGIDATHPDLKDNYLYGKSFLPDYPNAGEDGNGHGTHVAGTIAANGRVNGVGPNLGLASYRVLDPTGHGGSVGVIAQAIVTAADDGADVINLSIEGYQALSDRQSLAEYLVLKRAVDYANKKGSLMVAAAGNNGLDLHKKNQIIPSIKGPVVEIPAGIPGVIGVSATNKLDQLAFYSNYGLPVIDFTAPGGDFGPNFDPVTMTGEMDFFSMNLSTIPGGDYYWSLGTSMATPKVSAIAGLIIAEQGNIGSAKVASILKRTARDLGKPGRDAYYGNGMVNAQEAVSIK